MFLYLLKFETFSKIEIVVKNQNIGQKSKFGQKQKFYTKVEFFFQTVEILIKNRNFRKKSKFLSKVEMFGKTPKIDQKSKFGHTSKFSKIQILVENRTSVLTLRGFSTYNKKNIFLKTSMSGLKNPSKWYFREYFKIKKISGHMKFPISYIS